MLPRHGFCDKERMSAEDSHARRYRVPEQRPRSSYQPITAAAGLQVRHDVCSPLTVIRGNAQLLRRRLAEVPGLSGTEQRRLWRHLTAIEAATAQLAAAVDRLLPRQ